MCSGGVANGLRGCPFRMLRTLRHMRLMFRERLVQGPDESAATGILQNLFAAEKCAECTLR